MPSLSQRLIIDYPSLFHRDHIISRSRIALWKTLIVITYCIIVCTNQCTYTKRDARFFSAFFIHRDGSASTQNGQIRREITRREEDSERRGYIDSWGGWISDPRSISGRWRCFTIEDNAQKTIRQFQAAFPGGINRPSFKPSALLVLPFFNPRQHHPAASRGISPSRSRYVQVRGNYSNYRGLA